MFFTQNPIGSSATEDLQDNAISFDYAMNSPAALWQDRFGKQHKTVQQALKDVGFKPAGFDFVSGGTLGIGDRDKCVFYPTDGYWYSWNGKLPYVVPANSSPTPGGVKGWKLIIKDDTIIPREALRRTYQEVGLNLVAGSFEQGGTLQSSTDVLLEEKTGKCYSWSGSFPKTVDKNTLPSSNPSFINKVISRWLADSIKAITWEGLDGGANGDVASNNKAINWACLNDIVVIIPEGTWNNTVDSTFNIYPDMRNKSGGFKVKRGIPGKGTPSNLPLIWAEKTSNAQRTPGGTKIFDISLQGALTLEPTATAFGVGVSGYVRSSAGDVLTAGKSIDAIGVHGSGKAVGRNGRVWGVWAQAGNGDDGSGVRSSQIIAAEFNLVNIFDSQPHPEVLPTGEGPYRGLIVTTADQGKRCGIGIDVGDGSGRVQGESGWWMGIRLRKNGITPAGDDWKENYFSDSQQLKIEGADGPLYRYGGLRIGPRTGGDGKYFTYGINMLAAEFQDYNAINLAHDQRIYWGDGLGVTHWIGFEKDQGNFNFRNMTIAINSERVVGVRKTGFQRLTGQGLKTSFDTETATTLQIARRLKALEDALHADTGHGLIGI